MHETKKRFQPVTPVVAALLVLGSAGFTAHRALATPSAAQPHSLSGAQALTVLQAAFGSVAAHPIHEGHIVVVPTSAAIAALSDEVNIGNGATNPHTGAQWRPGDTLELWPLGIRGFTDVVTGEVYVNAQAAIETTTPHEMLHSNSSPEFLDTLGLALYEGTTEQLALDALAASGVRRPARPEYEAERGLVAKVVGIAGRDRLGRAYFNGGDDLASLVEALGSQLASQLRATRPS